MIGLILQEVTYERGRTLHDQHRGGHGCLAPKGKLPGTFKDHLAPLSIESNCELSVWDEC